MKKIAFVALMVIGGQAMGQGTYEKWVAQEFAGAYQQVQRCVPLTVRWEAQNGDPVQAEIWRDATNTYLRTEVPMVSADGTRISDVMTLVDIESDGTINRATMRGETFSGDSINEYPMLTFMFHTAVAVASTSGQCPN